MKFFRKLVKDILDYHAMLVALPASSARLSAFIAELDRS